MLEIRIESVNKDNPHSWVRISHGLNKLATDLSNKEETSTTKTEVFAFASRSKAKAKPRRPSTTCSSSSLLPLGGAAFSLRCDLFLLMVLPPSASFGWCCFPLPSLGGAAVPFSGMKGHRNELPPPPCTAVVRPPPFLSLVWWLPPSPPSRSVMIPSTLHLVVVCPRFSLATAHFLSFSMRFATSSLPGGS